MKLKTFKIVVGLALLNLSLGFATSAQAISMFNSSANIVYTLVSVENLDDPGNFEDLDIFGDIILDSEFTDFSGDGFADDSLVDNSAGDDFDFTLNVNGGSPANGFADVSFGAFADLFFDNFGDDQFAIVVDIAYTLVAAVSGTNADSTVFLDYSNESDGSFSGGNSANASTFSNLEQTINGNDQFSFTLGAQGSEAILADFVIDGVAQSEETGAVPEPNVLLLMLLSLMALPLLRKRNV